jgi:hypothetical protein
MKWGFIVGHMKIAKCWVAVLLLLGLACVAPAWASKLEVKPAQAHEVEAGKMRPVAHGQPVGTEIVL